jgi:hypothetical protein
MPGFLMFSTAEQALAFRVPESTARIDRGSSLLRHQFQKALEVQGACLKLTYQAAMNTASTLGSPRNLSLSSDLRTS